MVTPTLPRPVSLTARRDAELARVAPDPDTLPGAVALWRESSVYRQGLRPGTRRTYDAVVNRACRALPERPTAAQVDGWLASCVDKGISPATRNVWLAYLLSVANVVRDLTDNGSLRRIIREVPVLPTGERPVRVPPSRLVDVLLRHTRDVPTERLAVELAAFHGLRQGELLGLRPEDYCWQSGTLTVLRSRTEDGIGDRKSRRRGRRSAPRAAMLVLDLDKAERATVETLCDHYGRAQWLPRAPGARKASVRALAEGWLFPWSPSYLDALARRWRRELPDVAAAWGKGNAWHSLRHYFGVATYAATGSKRAAQRGLGDSTEAAAGCYSRVLRGSAPGLGKMVRAAFEADRGRDVTDLFAGHAPGECDG